MVLLQPIVLIALLLPGVSLQGQSRPKTRETATDWIQGEVRYLITEQERAVYRRLTTAEERENFIDEFWRRRDPDPRTPENEFREEFYRRVAFANENFGAGMPGWLTDRGRVYVLYGPPNRRDAHPMGGRYQKPPNQGGDTITTYPFEIWEYDSIPGIGTDLTIEFVDHSGSGLYTLETDPNRKDVFYWRRGEMPQQRAWLRAKDSPFERVNVWARFQSPPPLRFQKLREEVKADVSYSPLPYDVSTGFVRMSADTCAVLLTLFLANDKLEYAGMSGFFQAELQLFASVTNLNGATVYQFDEDFKVATALGEPLSSLLKRRTEHQRIIPLSPGRYRINTILKDVHSGKLGVRDAIVWIPQVSESGLNTSSLIYADVIQPASKDSAGDEFVLGPLKVVPNATASFQRRHQLGLYLEIYDLGLDQTTRKPSVRISYSMEGPDGKELRFGNDSESRFEAGASLAIAKAIPLSELQPGRYRVVVSISDLITERRCTVEGQVQVL